MVDEKIEAIVYLFAFNHIANITNIEHFTKDSYLYIYFYSGKNKFLIFKKKLYYK